MSHTAVLEQPTAPSVRAGAPDITPTGGALGAIVTGLDAARPVAPETVLRLKAALNEHHVLIFKDQTLTEEQLLAFATLFGAPFVPPGDVPVLGSAQGTPTVVTIANVDGGLTGHGELAPHIDHQWTPYPSSGSLLYALELPRHGGDTHWINLVRAYEELDPDTKAQIAGLRLLTYNPFVRAKDRPRSPYRVAAQDPPEGPVYPHPLVRTHPDSGRKILYLNEGGEVELVGVDPEAGSALIARLRAHVHQPRYTYVHRWSVGDVVFWDNQATQHYRPAFDPNERRVLKRVSLAGGRPF